MANFELLHAVSNVGLSPQRSIEGRYSIAISRTKLAHWLLHLAFFMALYRTTGMWFGYPSTQNENSTIDPAVMQMVLYSIVPILGVVVLLIPRSAMSTLRGVPALVVLICLCVLIATALSRDLMASMRGLIALVVVSAPVLLFRLLFGPEKAMAALRRFAAAAIIANFLYILAFPGYGIMGGSLSGSARGMFVHKNIFGQFSAAAFLLLLPFPMQRPFLRYGTLFYGLCALIALVCVVLSMSSTALALTMAGLMMMSFAYVVTRVPSRSVRAYIFLVVIVLGSFGTYTLGSLLLDTFASSVGKDATFSGRSEVWQALLLPIAERPIFGHGFAVFRQPDYIASYTSQIAWGPRSTHNTYIEIALNMGLPAAVLWVIFLMGRLAGKFVNQVDSASLRNLRIKEVGVMTAIGVGAFTEAGVMLAPIISWVILLALMPRSTGLERRFSSKPSAGGGRHELRYGLSARLRR